MNGITIIGLHVGQISDPKECLPRTKRVIQACLQYNEQPLTVISAVEITFVS
jgi:hypothetical protein